MLDHAAPQAIQPMAALGRHKHHQCYGNSPRSGWIVAITQPQAERWANANLQRQGYQTYLPTYLARRRDHVLHTLTRLVERPLFPGYLFVHYDSRDPRRPIRETPGVRDVIRCGSKVQWVRDGAVEAVINAEATRNALHGADGLSATEPPWTPGTPCSLAAGPLAGHLAVILSIGQNMVLVSILLFGQLREVAVDANCLVPREEG